MFQLLWTQLSNWECVLVYVFVWMHNDPFTLWTKKSCWIQRIVLIIKDYRNDGKRLWRWQWQWYRDQFFHSISWLTITMTVGLTHGTYWCSSAYVTMTLTLLNLDCWHLNDYFPLVNIFRWLENKKVADRLIELRDNIRQPSKFWDKFPKSKQPQSKKTTKMSKKSSVALLLWQSLSSSVLCLILWNLF